MANGPKFPDVNVPLAGEDGNAFAILGRVRKALRRAGKRLQSLLDAGTIYRTNLGNYLAVASDGVEVCISGPLYEAHDVQRAEAYLADCPGPEAW